MEVLPWQHCVRLLVINSPEVRVLVKIKKSLDAALTLIPNFSVFLCAQSEMLLVCLDPKLSCFLIQIANTEISAGVIPLIRDAWPNVSGA